MPRSGQLKKLTTVILLILITAVPLSAQDSASDQSLKMIPSDALFCVRINNFDYSLSQTDQFLAGVSPMPISMLVRMQLAQFLGNPQLAGLNTNGNFSVFATVLSGNPAGDNPPGNLFFGILAPVTDYQQLITGSPNLSEPDENGISKITQNGSPTMLAAKIGNHVLLSQAGEYEKFASSMKTLSAISSNLAGSLDSAESKLATTEPVWIYCNMQQVSSTFGPMISAKIEGIKNMFGNMPPEAMGAQPQNMQNVINMYAGILEMLMKETKSISIAINPKPNALNITKTITAAPGTDMSKMFVANTSSGQNKLLGYIKDGSMMNIASRMNTPLMKIMNTKGFDLLFKLSGENIADEQKEMLKTYMTNWNDCLGDSMVVSVSIDPDKKPPFEAEYVISIKDPQKFNSLIDEIPEMMNTSGIMDFYKGMGMETDFEIKRASENYKGVSIDSAKLIFKSTAPDSPQGQMINTMYGDGFDYRWGLVNDLCVMTIGGDPDTTIHSLIDQVKEGTPTQTANEFKAAMDLLLDAGRADFVATYNLIRAFKMVTSMVPVPMPKVDMPSQSNIAIAGKSGDGKLVVNIAIPKTHLSEIMSLVMTMQMQNQQNNNMMNQP